VAIKLWYQNQELQVLQLENSLQMVDLAGSERAKRTENIGSMMVESCAINGTLLVLGRCLQALRDSKVSQQVIPYRDCKLTKVLYEYFTEGNNLIMMSNICTEKALLEETIKVLNFASNAKDIKPIKNRQNPLHESNLHNQGISNIISTFSNMKINTLECEKENARIHIEEVLLFSLLIRCRRTSEFISSRAS